MSALLKQVQNAKECLIKKTTEKLTEGLLYFAKRNEMKSVLCEMNLYFAKWKSVLCEMEICTLRNETLTQ